MSTDCGGYRIATTGRVARLPRHWLARHSGSTSRPWEPPHVIVRRDRAGRYFLLREGRLVWRSSRLYPNDGGSIGFGPGEFAFASYRHGVYLTDLTGPERLAVRGRGIYPYDFTSTGDLIVTGGRTIVLVSPRGRTVRQFTFRMSNGFSFDERTDTLFFVTRGGRLAAVRNRHVRLERRITSGGGISARRNVLVFTSAHAITVTRRDGSVVARAQWHSPRSAVDSGVSVAPGGRSFVFRVSDARPGARSSEATLYLLRAGWTRAEILYRHRLGPSGCAVGANLSWHGRYVLYTSFDRHEAVVDTATRRLTDLRRLARALPTRSSIELASAAWASDFRR